MLIFYKCVFYNIVLLGNCIFINYNSSANLVTKSYKLLILFFKFCYYIRCYSIYLVKYIFLIFYCAKPYFNIYD